MTPRQFLKLILGLGFSLGFAYLAARNLDWDAFLLSLADASSWWVSIAVVLFVFAYACRVQRWRVMLLSSGSKVGFWRSAVPLLASVATNNVLPFRAGDALRAFAFSKWLGVGTSRVIATLFVERMLDLLSLLVCAALVLRLLAQDLHGAWNILGVGGHLLTIGALAILVLLLYPRLFAGPAHVMVIITNHISARYGARLGRVFDQMLETLQHQAKGKQMLKLMTWSALAWMLEGAVFYAAGRALPAITELAGAVLAFPVATLATLLPSAPGYLGTFDFFAIRMAELAGNPPAAAFAFAVLVHMILWITATLAGGISILIWIVYRNGGSATKVAASTQ